MKTPIWKTIAGAFVKLDDGIDARDEAAANSTDIEKLLAEVRGKSPASVGPTPVPATPVPTTPVPTTPVPATPVDEGRSFTEIYKAAGVPDSPYPCEQLLKVLDGLIAMPVATRQQVVAAMDAADDAWTITDPVLDAQNKMSALQTERTRIVASVQAAEVQAAADSKAQDEYLLKATAEIRRQIGELQATLESEVSDSTRAKGDIDARLRAARESASRANARIDQESNRLSQVPNMFGTSAITSNRN